MSTPKTSASSGTIITPPPRPVSAPRNPATSPPAPTSKVNSTIFNSAPSFRYLLTAQSRSLLLYRVCRAVLERNEQKTRVGAEKIHDAARHARGQPQHLAGVQERDVLPAQIRVQIRVRKRDEQSMNFRRLFDVISSLGHFAKLHAHFIRLEIRQKIIGRFRCRLFADGCFLRAFHRRSRQDFLASLSLCALRAKQFDCDDVKRHS